MRVSVVLPTYNRAKLLEKSLNSLIRLNPDEVIVINDGSTDETEKILIEFSNRLKERIYLKVITHKKKVGTAKCRNEGVNNATGELVFFTDDDHFYPDQDLLKKVKKIFIEKKQVGAIVLNEEKEKKLETKITLKKRLIMLLTEWIFLEAYKRKQGYVKYGSSAMVVRRSIMNHVKYDEGYLGNCWREESQLQLDIQKLGWKIYFDPTLRFYHAHAEFGGHRKGKEFFYWTIRNHTRFLKKNFLWKILPFFLLFLQANIRKRRVKEFIKAFSDGIKS